MSWVCLSSSPLTLSRLSNINAFYPVYLFCPLCRLRGCLFICPISSMYLPSMAIRLNGLCYHRSLWYRTCRFPFLSFKSVYTAVYSSTEYLDKQLRESTVFNTTERNHSIFLKDVWDCCTGDSQWYSQIGRKNPHHVVGDLFYCSLLFFKYSAALELSVGPIIC